MSITSTLLHTRWLVRAPIWLFRARLGFLFGGRMLLLEHTGRTTGRPRYVVLEAVEHPAPTRVVVASGFGIRSQWFQNLQADQRCRVSIRRLHQVPAIARTVTDEERAAIVARYRSHHPRAYAELSGVTEETVGLRIDEVPYVELTLR
ncbi:nitroreductase family deazaflavin-dependent oxidoreductase [Gordonia sp. LSe1-13]|uniref:Nitroreductase family deazaflavin-dependent oxidoreductase n=1 Tax=Gordonia sesuvii TaxID=3116777 RepID=A0ABU7MFH3_9ACTN|nr:nitroreductase family deazaflavin-dependent oxidoreductase [Gordonia sp. LSe1-13]